MLKTKVFKLLLQFHIFLRFCSVGQWLSLFVQVEIFVILGMKIIFYYALDIWGITLWRSESCLNPPFSKFSLTPPWQKKGAITSLLLGGSSSQSGLHWHFKGEGCLIISQQGWELRFPLAPGDTTLSGKRRGASLPLPMWSLLIYSGSSPH